MTRQRIPVAFAATLLIAATVSAQCPGFPGCLYRPQSVDFRETGGSVTYFDVAGQTRTVNIYIREPVSISGLLPVVVWSHGGAGGQFNSEGALREWSIATARAGYLTVSIAHSPRGIQERSNLCSAIGITSSSECEVFKYLNWDRPHDIRRVLDELVGKNAQGPLQGRIDLSRIAVGGHSAGSGGALSVAGAVRVFNRVLHSFPDVRPVAFIAFSPQGPTSEGFFDTDFGRPDTSWSPIEEPVLVGTGDGDSSCDPPGDCIPGSETPYGRRTAFNRMPGPGKYLFYVHDTDAYHGLWGLDSDCVAKGVSPSKCQAFKSWMTSAALAFLDAHVRQSNIAKTWLENGFIRTASNNVVEWRQK